jgi:proline iminopeptidase
MRALTTLLVSFAACAPPETAALVPPTVVDDPALPSLTIRVAGRERRVHVRTFGDPSRHVVLAMHGSLADARYLLMLAPLADEHFVVAWDQRGNGLSERLDGPDEYTADAIVEEIDAVADAFSPGRPFSLVGHSFGAMFASLYVGRRPQRVDRLALLEPGGLSGAIFGPTYPSLIRVDLLGPGLNAMFWQNELLSPSTHERLDLRALMMLEGENTPGYFCDAQRPPDLPVWRPGGHVDLLRGLLLQGKAAPGAFDYDFTVGVDAYRGPVVLVGGTCSLLGPDYQRRYHLPFFPRGRVVSIDDAGHRFPTEKPAETVALVRAFLTE